VYLDLFEIVSAFTITMQEQEQWPAVFWGVPGWCLEEILQLVPGDRGRHPTTAFSGGYPGDTK
jgi:hypothetical protein